MSSSITTTLIMGVGLAVGAAVAYSELVLVRMNVPGSVLFRTSLSGAATRLIINKRAQKDLKRSNTLT